MSRSAGVPVRWRLPVLAAFLAQFDTVYREGRWQLRSADPGAAQVLDLTPAGGGFVETVLPAPGHYPVVSHVMVDPDRGTIEVR
ncbi:hypothetical protein [Actinoplanes sp. ATCC 53533]|uniref:hypothetical protein n=1 Tax=Actinoplanes sp. ATCC 53533 TaxID=1288362 RepID=UPI001F381052|nr:hypothetical protein [Actinoplanes sp. ATCC 53533]